MLDRYITVRLSGMPAGEEWRGFGVFDRDRGRTIESGSQDSVRQMVDRLNRQHRASRRAAHAAAVRASIERTPVHFDRSTEGF